MKMKMKHVKEFNSFVNEAKVIQNMEATKSSRELSKIETLFFGKLNFETRVQPTTKSEREFVPLEGSVTVVVSLGSEGSVEKDIKKYEVSDAAAKALSVKLKERFDKNDYNTEIPELTKMKEAIHKEELKAFMAGLETFEKSFSK
jgi:hypothetical protein